MHILSFQTRALLTSSSLVTLGAITVLTWNVIGSSESTALTASVLEEKTRARPEEEFLLEADRTDGEIITDASRDTPPAHLLPEQAQALEALRKKIEDEHGIVIRMFDPSPLSDVLAVNAVPYAPESLDSHLRALEAWLQVYPTGYLRTVGLSSIYLFRGWEKSGVETNGFLIDRHTIAIQASEDAFHHQLFHIADINDGGIESDNYDWQRMKFGESIPGAHDIPQITINEALSAPESQRPLGYASVYGKRGGVNEDQATVATELLTRPALLASWTKNDAALSAAALSLREYFYVRSNGKMDETFWNDLRDGNGISKSYWLDRDRTGGYIKNEEFERTLSVFRRTEEARQLLREGKTVDAERLFAALVAEFPDRMEFTYELGGIHKDRGEYDKAIELYTNALARHPFGGLSRKLAVVYKEAGQINDSLAHYERAFKNGMLSPVETREFSSLYEQVASGLIAEGKTREGINTYLKMLGLFGENSDWRREVGKARQKTL